MDTKASLQGGFAAAPMERRVPAASGVVRVYRRVEILPCVGIVGRILRIKHLIGSDAREPVGFADVSAVVHGEIEDELALAGMSVRPEVWRDSCDFGFARNTGESEKDTREVRE